MPNPHTAFAARTAHSADSGSDRFQHLDDWTRPSFEVISLDCEITSYAPDDADERPLF